MKTTPDTSVTPFDPFSLAFWRSHLSLIILIPYLLGGIWQLLELYSISPVYVRFFSLTQTIPDGLMMLFIFLLIMLVVLIWRNRPSLEKWIEKWLPVDTVISTRLFTNVFAVLITWAVVYFLLVGGGIFGETFNTESLIIALLWSAIYLSRDRYKDSVNKGPTIRKNVFLLARLVLIVVFVWQCIQIIPDKIKKINDKLIAIEAGITGTYYKVRIADHIGAADTSGINVLYFNDEYLFIENESNRCVVPFGILFKAQDSVHWSPIIREEDFMDDEYYEEESIGGY